MRKVIFLDVDGVLNSEKYAFEKILVEGKQVYRGYGGFFKEHDEPTKNIVKWDPVLVDRIKNIVESTGAEIVMSSTWRRHFSVNKFKEMFALYGWENAPVIDRTVELGTRILDGTCRGFEVNEWLSRNLDVTSYVILDDIPQFLPDQQLNFVNTFFETGISEYDVINAIIILNQHDFTF